MQRRQITLDDGRYLIFYTFDEEAPADDAAAETVEPTATDAQAVAEEERRV